MSTWWPWALALVPLSVLLREEPMRNLSAFLGSRPMGLHDDWPEVRVKASLEAQARITAYAKERSDRLRAYEANWLRSNFRIAR